MVQTNQSRLFSADCYKDSYKDNFSFKIKDQKKDTLSITALQNGTKFQRPLYFRNCNPLVGFDNSKIQLTNKDSTAVAFKTE
jgi:hypothetical protein